MILKSLKRAAIIGSIYVAVVFVLLIPSLGYSVYALAVTGYPWLQMVEHINFSGDVMTLIMKPSPPETH